MTDRPALLFTEPMEYVEAKIRISPFTEDNADWIVAEIESLGFDSFSTEEPFLKAYIPKKAFDREELDKVLSGFDGVLDLVTECSDVEQANWNSIWESQFQPITVDGRCTVKATFHKDLPDTEYNIVIDPKMAFGTGHHQTTHMMISWLLDDSPASCSVLDMGCGTGILAILAALRGAASPVDAIDIDDVAAASAVENAALNGVSDSLRVRCGDASLLHDGHYDVVLANINRNILMNDIPVYVANMNPGARLYVSGFYNEDIPLIVAVARKAGLKYVAQKNIDNWASVKFVLTAGK